MIARQAASFVLIGLAVNAALYAAYLLLTHTLLGAFATMTVTYSSGVVVGFVLNRKFTFHYRGADRGALLRYIASYAIGYWVDYGGLWFFVDHMGVAHELAQGGLVVTIALLLFALQRYWVFAGSAAPLRIHHVGSTP